MRLLRQIPGMLLAALLALSIGIGVAPRVLLAAPVTQTDAEVIGYWESDVLPSEDSEGLVVGLVLYEDGSAEIISDYLNDEDPILEVGEWVENDDGTLTLTVTGTGEEDYPSPIELVFEIGDDGELVIPGAPDGIFGEAGLALLPVELAEEDAAAEDTGDETGSATDALLQDLPEDAFVYQSEVIPDDGLQLTLVLYADNTLELVSDNATDGEIVVEVGTWAETDEGVEVTLTGLGDGSEYEDPLVFEFILNEEGGLDLVDEGGELFGEAGLTLAPFTGVDDAEDAEGVDDGAAATMTVAPAGAYVSDLLPSDEGASTFLVALLYDDTSIIITTYTTDGSLPETEIGEWVDNGDGSYILNITGTLEEEYDEPVPLDFTVEDDGSLDIFGIPLYPLEDFELEAEDGATEEGATEEGAAEEGDAEEGAADDVMADYDAVYAAELVVEGADTPVLLALGITEDGLVAIYADFQDGEEALASFGEWVDNEDGTYTLTFTEDMDGELDEPVELTVSEDDEGLLTVTDANEAGVDLLDVVFTPVDVSAE